MSRDLDGLWFRDLIFKKFWHRCFLTDVSFNTAVGRNIGICHHAAHQAF